MTALDRPKAYLFAKELAALVPASILLWALFAKGVYPLIGWTSRAPIPARSALLVVLLWFLMKNSGETWAGFGLTRPKRIWLAILLAFVFLVAKITVIQPLADWVTSSLELSPADHSFFLHLHGNPVALSCWLVVAWTVGGFAEELLFRGYLMRRLADLVHGTPAGWALAVVGQALLFGVGHFYLGPAGMLSSAVGALFYGLFFFVSGRNLWPLIILHGTWDSLGLVLIFFNGTPSTS